MAAGSSDACPVCGKYISNLKHLGLKYISAPIGFARDIIEGGAA
jgi:hypothetical protein